MRKKLPRDNMSIREQVDFHCAHNSSSPFRCEFNAEDSARFAKHAPVFWAAWQSDGDHCAAAYIDHMRLLDARRINGHKLSPDGERVMNEIGELHALFVSADRLQRNADELAANRSLSVDGGPQWRDSEGRAIRVLRPQDRLATQPAPTGVDLGTVVRAMVTGRGLQEINNAMAGGSVSTGGALFTSALADQIIDRMRARSTIIRAGALTVPMPAPTLLMARITGDPTLSWAAEAASLSESSPTLDQVSFVAKTLRGWTYISRELIEDAANLNDALVQTFSNAMAVEVDRVGLVGSGSGQEPRGIGNATSAAPITLMGANGAQLTNWDKVLDLLDALTTANAADPTAMIFAPRTATTINKWKDTTNQPLQVPPALANIPRLVTTAMPITQTQGTANNASSIILGHFPELMIGVRSELQIVRAEAIASNQIALGFVMRADVQWRHAESFAQLRGLIP